MRARLLAPQAVPGARLTAWVRSPSGKWTNVKFTEHTGGRGDTEEAFIYTAAVQTPRQERGQYLICVDAFRRKGSFEIELDEFYRRKPGLRPEDMKRKVAVPAIRRRRFIGIAVDEEGRTSKDPLHGFNTRRPWVHPRQAALLKRWKAAHKKR